MRQRTLNHFLKFSIRLSAKIKLISREKLQTLYGKSKTASGEI